MVKREPQTEFLQLYLPNETWGTKDQGTMYWFTSGYQNNGYITTSP